MKVYRRRNNDMSARRELLASGPGDAGWTWDRSDNSESFSIGVDTLSNHRDEYSYALETDSRIEAVKIIAQLLRCAMRANNRGPNYSGKAMTEIEKRVEEALVGLGIKDKWGSTILE